MKKIAIISTASVLALGAVAIAADADEVDANPRARSAKLRVATRTDVPSGQIDAKSIGMPYTAGVFE